MYPTPISPNNTALNETHARTLPQATGVRGVRGGRTDAEFAATPPLAGASPAEVLTRRLPAPRGPDGASDAAGAGGGAVSFFPLAKRLSPLCFRDAL